MLHAQSTVKHIYDHEGSYWEVGSPKSKAGIDEISVHTLRHTFATRCIEAGMIPKTLQTILGHARLEMTMNLYVHVTDEKRTQEVIGIEDKLKVV